MSQSRTPSPLWIYGLFSALGALVMGGGQPPVNYPSPPPNYPNAPHASTPQPSTAVPSAQPTTEQLTERLIADAQASFARVRDYTGTFVRQERVNGQLLPEQTIVIKVRQQPFSIYMKWIAPKTMSSQEACYVAGRNENRMRAKSGGALLGAIGFVSLDPRDPRAMAGNRHSITDAGIGHMIDQMARGFDLARRLPANQVQLQIADYIFQKKPVTRSESIHMVNNGQFYAHRCVTFYDKETRLPVRFEAYDWPTAGGNPAGELIECYNYVDLRFNVGLTDAVFNH